MFTGQRLVVTFERLVRKGRFEKAHCMKLKYSSVYEMSKRRIGVIGFGQLGEFLVENILASDDLELAFVWNRNSEIVQTKLGECHTLHNLNEFQTRKPDLVIEVAHPDITKEFGTKVLQVSDYMIGSPTALADVELFSNLRKAANQHGLYIPSGALWGGEDIQKMADTGTLQALKITMTFHSKSLKLLGSLKEKNELVTERTILYEGCVLDLCSLAPNNVNTMAAAAIAGHNLGFAGTQGCLISDPGAGDWHVVQVDAWGQGDIATGEAFHVQTVRRNPARVGAVTGSATRQAFLACLQRAHGRGCGIHLC